MYAGKVILAPMVRENKLPFRLLALQFGADLVYSEELIDYRLSTCTRVENNSFGTVDFIDKRGDIVFRTCSEEKGRVILQLGSNNPERALESAKRFSADVAGFDFNFGCPKSFSLSGGMGAALLEKPDQIEAILKHCVTNLDLPVTCKIRVLPNLEETLKLVKMIESCGVAALAVHGRTKAERPTDDNRDDYIKEIVKIVKIPVIANGGSNDFQIHSDIVKFKELTGASSVMVARAAMYNPSILSPTNQVIEIDEIIERYLKLAVKYENTASNSKYVLQKLMSTRKYSDAVLRKFNSSANMGDICSAFGLGDWYEATAMSKPVI